MIGSLLVMFSIRYKRRCHPRDGELTTRYKNGLYLAQNTWLECKNVVTTH
jgi:hypothetical protein